MKIAKMSTMFFGYSNPLGPPLDRRGLLQEITKRHRHRVVVHRLLHLAQDGAVHILYMDNTIEERRVVVYRFTSDRAYDQYHRKLVETAEGIEKGIWEPYRNGEQHHDWLTELPSAAPTIVF